MALNEYEIKKMICDVGKRIYDRNMVAANDGNISVKLNDNEFLCTPTGVSKGFMTPEYICKVDAQGNVIQANKGFKPSSEIKMHMRVYAKRPDVGAVVHAHPTFATSFAIAGIPLTQPIMPEAVIALGCVPIAPYGTPSTMEIPDAVEPYLEHFDAVLLESHGALTWSTDLMAAYMKMESVEFYAELLYKAKQLGVRTMCVTNKENSTAWNTADYRINCEAGEEKSIASTKALTAQTLCLYLLALKFAQMKKLEISEHLENLKKLPEVVENSLNLTDKIKPLARFLSTSEACVVVCVVG